MSHGWTVGLFVALVAGAMSLSATGRADMGRASEQQGGNVVPDAMMRGARKLVDVNAEVRPGETVLIVTDARTLPVARAVAAAVEERKAEPVVTIITQRRADSTEPPPSVAAAMKAADVIFSAVSISITHTQAMKAAVAGGARAIALTAFTEQMLASGGIDGDFAAIREQCRAVGRRLSGATVARLTSAEGTDLTLRVGGRRVNVMSGIVGKGEFSPVPTAEVNVSPIEGTANGVLVADASIPYLGIGLLTRPVRFTIRDGFIVAVDGGDPAQVDRLTAAWKAQGDPMVYNIAEMGIGMNPACRFVGLMLEDEGVLGSVHIGTGTNITLGGTVKAGSHYDLIMRAPTLTLDGGVLIEAGRLTLPAARTPEA